MDQDLRLYLTKFQEQTEEYIRDLSKDVKEISHEDVGLQDQWSPNDNVYYDQDGFLYFMVGGIKVCWFDWAGNWYRAVNFDNFSTDLTKTNSKSLYAYDNNTGTLDIFHNDNQVISISSGEITIDNDYALITGATLDSVTSLNWIDEANDADGNLNTFISVKGNRVLEIEGTDVKLKGAIKLG
jgi:hypothetical protein